MLGVMLWILVILHGLIGGSFLNVVVHRLPNNDSLFTPGSHCPNCQASIAWYDNIPILSFLWLGGQCRSCGQEISLRYVAVELLVLISFAGTYLLSSSWTGFVVLSFFVMILLGMALIDVEHYIIPNALNYGLFVLGLILIALPVSIEQFPGTQSYIKAALGAVIGFVVLIGISKAIVWRDEPGLGGGDIKLLASLGLLLGPLYLAEVLFVSSVVGLLFALPGLLLGNTDFGAKIPFGPYIVIGAFITTFGQGFFVQQWVTYVG